MNKKVITILVIVIGLVIITGGFWYSQEKKSSNNNQIVKKENSQNGNLENQEQAKDLVWYEIPELGIKFLVPREMAKLIGYRDFYVQDTKADGKELYIKDDKEKIVFAKLILDRAVKNSVSGNYHFNSEYCLGNKNIKILTTKEQEYRVCYLDVKHGNKNLSFIANDSFKFANELLNGYLKNTQISLISK